MQNDRVGCFAAAQAGAPLAATHVTLPALGPHDVELAVTACALCHSDVHLLDGDWSSGQFPLVPGHEIVGRVVGVGGAVPQGDAHAHLTLGARAGVGWQCGACFACEACERGREHQCPHGKVRTCVGRPGGLAERVRVDHRFAFALPHVLDDAHAAPLLCAGLTVFSALERHVHNTRGSTRPRVAVVGLGGLGHLAVQFARALGAEVHAFDPDADKRSDALALGATEFSAPASPASLPSDEFDVVLSTTSAPLPWNDWLRATRLGGTLCLVGVPPAALTIDPDHLLDGEKIVTGSVVGSRASMDRMLAFAAQHDVAPRVETLPMRDVNEGLARLREGRARYRVSLLASTT